MEELAHFIAAQQASYQTALAQVRSGRKQSHWMWYIFPQLNGLGQSGMAKKYVILGMDHAQAYLSHPVLGKRLVEISRAALASPAASALALMGSPDDLKLRSCMTLFAQLPGADPVFSKVLERYFDAVPDPRTLQLLGKKRY